MNIDSVILFSKIVLCYYVLKFGVITVSDQLDKIKTSKKRQRVFDALTATLVITFIHAIYMALTKLSGLSYFFAYLMLIVTLGVIIIDERKKPSPLDFLGILIFSIAYTFFNLFILLPI